jgi:hypothetical protein
MMAMNLATVCDKLGRTDEALSWFDEGVELERAHGRFFVAEHRAAYLADNGRENESLERYEELLLFPGLTSDDRDRIERNVHLLRERTS